MEDLTKKEAELSERVAYLRRELERLDKLPDNAALVARSGLIDEYEATKTALDKVRRQIGPPRFFPPSEEDGGEE